MSAAADSNPRVGTPGEERPLYGLPHDVERLRSMVPWQRTVQSSTGPTPQSTITMQGDSEGPTFIFHAAPLQETLPT
jgi:hypothetical protein